MKKRKLIRLTSIILTLCLFATMLPVLSFAATASSNLRPGTVGTLENDYAQIEKWAEPTAVPNEYLITLKILGKDITVSSGADIVLVIDGSGSMSDSISSMKSAAQSFVDNLLTKGSANRIAIVSFSNTAKTRIGLTGYQAAAGNQEANTNIKNAINGISSSGGTNTQAGIYAANQILGGSSAANKYIVLLSDGVPTYNFPAKFDNLKVTNCEKNGKHNDNCKNSVISGTEVTGYDYSDLTNYEGEGDSTNYSKWATVYCNRNKKHYVYLQASSADAAIYEAKKAKDAGNIIWAIGYNTDTTAANILKKISSVDENGTALYKNASTDNIESIFNSIGSSITDSIKNTAVTDPMGALIDVIIKDNAAVQAAKSDLSDGDYYISQGTISYNAGTETFSWQPGLVDQSTPAVLKYKVRLDVEDPSFDMNKAYETNGITTFVYNKPGDTQSSTLNFKVPTVTGTYGQYFVKGYLVNANGQPINALGEVVSRENASVVYNSTAVVNAKGVNKWQYGTQSINALDITGHTIYGAASQNAAITTANPSKTVWFPYTVNTTGYTVEHYFEQANGTFVKDSTVGTGNIAYGQTITSGGFVISRDGYSYDAKYPLNISSITYTNESQTGLTLKLYYTRSNANVIIQYVFVGGPLNGSQNLSPTPEFKVGDVINGDIYKLDLTASQYNNYSFSKVDYIGLGQGNTVTSASGQRVVLTYEYAKVNVNVIHKYPNLTDVNTYNQAQYLGTEINVSTLGAPVTLYGGKLYTVLSTAVTDKNGPVTITDGKATANADTTITVTYALASQDYIVEHYFENLDGEYIKDGAVTGGGSINYGQTIMADAMIITRDGYTYNAGFSQGIKEITYSNDSTTGLTLKLYYGLNFSDLTVQYVFVGGPLSGSINLNPAPSIKIGQAVNGNDYKLDVTKEPYKNYSLNSIQYQGLGSGNTITTTPGAKVILTYEFDTVNVKVIHKYPGITDVITYDQDQYLGTPIDVNTIGAPILFYNGKLYTVKSTVVTDANGPVTVTDGTATANADTTIIITYELAKADFTVEHYFEQVDGSFLKDSTVGSGSIEYGNTVTAEGFKLTRDNYTYMPDYALGINKITYSNDSDTGLTLKLYYTRNNAEVLIQYVFVGGPLNGSQNLSPAPEFKVGDIINGDNYKLNLADNQYKNYSFSKVDYIGLGQGNTVTSADGQRVVLTYEYAKVKVNVIHRYPGLTDVETYNQAQYLGTEIDVDALGAPVLFYNGKLYTVKSTTVTDTNGILTVTDGKATVSADTTITIEYQVASSSFTVEYYFEQTDSTFKQDQTLSDGGSILYGETINDESFKILKDGYTYALDLGISSITYSNDSTTGLTLKLYYKINRYNLTIHYIYEDGSEAYADYTANDLLSGTEYNVSPPVIEGFEPDKEVVEGKLTENTVITVTYFETIPDPDPPLDPPIPTGDNTPILPILAGCLACSALIFIPVLKKKKESNN